MGCVTAPCIFTDHCHATETNLYTGTGAALQRIAFPVAVPAAYTSASLRFDFRFASAETIVPGEFADSFSITIRNTNFAYVTTVLTADRSGVAWAPTPIGGQELPPEALLFEPLPADPALAGLPFETGYSVLVDVPTPLLAAPVQLVLSLFDNQNPEDSWASLSHLEVKPGFNSPVTLESSAQAAGPFAEEAGVQINRLRQTLVISGVGRHRFFRLRADRPSQIRILESDVADWRFHIETDGVGPVPMLESSAAAEGPYAEEPAARAFGDSGLSLPKSQDVIFYRLQTEFPAAFLRMEGDGETIVFRYDYP